ncbi:hypothetical protein [Geodermatophilus sp. DSM 44513]|uniref:hypothetical protein n=1 Tax=Geodermatophilus sp. DSM 44513 TaxID=1528104 RepID=UPI001412230F|nr:hypothetical protein [Geodermatophilus sp. DSM 44513]WNV77534.1 hypothetical protein RTG05_09715 [Geodermatophilus sp. DSM 44513]
MVALTPPDAGANIGAGMVGLVADAVTIAAALHIVLSARSAAARLTGALTVLLVVLWVVLSISDALGRTGLIAFGASAIACLVVAGLLAGREEGKSASGAR